MTVTANEIITGMDTAGSFILALVEVDEDDQPHEPRYVWQPFSQVPEGIITSVNANLQEGLVRRKGPG